MKAWEESKSMGDPKGRDKGGHGGGGGEKQSRGKWESKIMVRGEMKEGGGGGR